MALYEQLKALTRGRTVSREVLRTWIHSLALPADDTARLLTLTPATYTGRASCLVRHIRSAATAAAPAENPLAY